MVFYRRKGRWGVVLIVGLILLAASGILAVAFLRLGKAPPTPAPPAPPPLKPVRATKVKVYLSERKPAIAWHPKHMVKVWLTTHRGRTFRVTQLPRCEHLEAVIAHNPSGETLNQAKQRFDGAAAMTGSFHDPRTMSLVDFLQRQGTIECGLTTGRWSLVISEGQVTDISDNYMLVKGKAGVSVIALGQRLVPLHHDHFSVAFMNRVTDRMALGLGKNYLFIVQGKSDIWRLADFMAKQLPVKIAINSDGGHVVRGRAPVHIVFRWRTQNASQRETSSAIPISASQSLTKKVRPIPN